VIAGAVITVLLEDGSGRCPDMRKARHGGGGLAVRRGLSSPKVDVVIPTSWYHLSPEAFRARIDDGDERVKQAFAALSFPCFTIADWRGARMLGDWEWRMGAWRRRG
jgi:hypothetical protein